MRDDYGYVFLLISRVARSVGIIYITLSSSLYLSALGVKPDVIGVVFLGAIGFSSVLTFSLGMIGDRYGYKKILIATETLACVASLILGTVVSNYYLIFTALIIGGVGGAAGGIRGAFSPGLTALVASNWKDERERIKRMSFLMSASSFSGIGGSILLSLRAYINNTIQGYRMLYLISFILLLISTISLFFVGEVKRPRKTSKIMSISSFKYISKVIISNSITGFGLGLAIPLLPLWFNLAFHANSFMIGLVFTMSYLFTAVGSLVSNKIKAEPLRVASVTRILNGVFLIAMALSPWFPLAALIYIIRGLNAGIGSPNRTMVNVRGVSAEDFGTASSIQGIATRLSQMSSGLSGYLLEYALPLPLEVGGVLQAIGGYVYMKLLSTTKSSSSYKDYKTE
ncbi:MFS transporter permease [Sulfolobus sp. A20]|uniref:MFS transporter n=1 Tax=Sulfolobaceae TaxID=118883 RepID=UPI000846034D|nr:MULTISPECIES: MFS transporter [unclassified Sulfolobus]TRM74994.1 MFS transporter [Sulfolobus sp. E5]TRM75190.1 MFS transporter [Sulfolobus sp. A20-N-F8]TRM79642.1 MFS transporter [Sulfolobus sp. B5]TRM81558.1 MFS transporter [Sulfolobus sp. D5]TRM83406.1 MFS transporter [Sulfolobus sp. A20-N-F6]TRM84774.1 MFS transporter [Sulfolobus sp. F3]TRM89050.1 MFS transporter [Sulfolobus sp. E3]TRN00495.1 MFS transporter [Sulfolobus sp. E1]TRN04651.1 MFS transporter [Sulfolobus sp. F1]